MRPKVIAVDEPVSHNGVLDNLRIAAEWPTFLLGVLLRLVELKVSMYNLLLITIQKFVGP